MSVRKSRPPLSEENGWRSSRRRWRDEARAALRQFPEVKDGKIIYDYGLVRIVHVEFKTESKPKKAILWSKIRRWLIDRGYDPTGAGLLECLRFRAEVYMTKTRLVLTVTCRRKDEVDDVPIYYRITQANYVQNRSQALKGLVYTDHMGREVLWSDREHKLRQIRYFHECVVKRAIRAGLRVPKKVLKDYPDLAKRTTSKGC